MRSKTKKLLKCWCYANGRIHFGNKVPACAIEIYEGPDGWLRKAVGVLARYSYPEKPGGKDQYPLVPGIPEAEDEQKKLEALFRFRKELVRREPDSASSATVSCN